MLKRTIGILSLAIAASGTTALPVAQAASVTAIQVAACSAKPGCGAKANPCTAKANPCAAKANPCAAKASATKAGGCGAKANPCAAKK